MSTAIVAIPVALLQKSGNEPLLASPHPEVRIHSSLPGPQLAGIQEDLRRGSPPGTPVVNAVRKSLSRP